MFTFINLRLCEYPYLLGEYICVCMSEGDCLLIQLSCEKPQSLCQSLANTLFFLLLPSHQNHLSEQDRGNVCVLSFFGATNKSSGAPHSNGGHIKVYSHTVWGHISAGTASNRIHPYVQKKKNESQKGKLSSFLHFHMSQFSEVLLPVPDVKSGVGTLWL